jgi:hypothetical protein
MTPVWARHAAPQCLLADDQVIQGP